MLSFLKRKLQVTEEYIYMQYGAIFINTKNVQNDTMYYTNPCIKIDIGTVNPIL